MDAADADATIRRYYRALRDGEPLYPYFVDADSVVKFGISERLTGYEAIADGLREQSAHTHNWTVKSRDLRVTQRDRHAWFSDDVRMAWTDIESTTHHAFDSRWSGTLERHDGWRFVGMHVSVAHDL